MDYQASWAGGLSIETVYPDTLKMPDIGTVKLDTQEPASRLSRESLIGVAIESPTSMSAGATHNLGAKSTATNECVDPQSNKHLLGALETKIVPFTTSSDA